MRQRGDIAGTDVDPGHDLPGREGRNMMNAGALGEPDQLGVEVLALTDRGLLLCPGRGRAPPPGVIHPPLNVQDTSSFFGGWESRPRRSRRVQCPVDHVPRIALHLYVSGRDVFQPASTT